MYSQTKGIRKDEDHWSKLTYHFKLTTKGQGENKGININIWEQYTNTECHFATVVIRAWSVSVVDVPAA